jgi:hypothetical protein
VAGTVLWGSVATLVAVALFWIKLPELRRATRPIYVRLGILPEITAPPED